MTSSLDQEEKNHGETKANLAKTKDSYKKEIENHLKKSVQLNAKTISLEQEQKKYGES